MKAFLSVILMSLCVFAQAEDEECKDGQWTLKGSIKKDIERYDKFLAGLSTSKDPIKDLNDYLKKHGLPLRAGVSAEGAVGFPNRVESGEESPGGAFAMVFLKAMKVEQSTGLFFDEVHELKSLTATKAEKSWPMPFETYPVAISENELFFRENLEAFCGTGTKTIGIAVKLTGEYRIVEALAKDEGKNIPMEQCTATEKVFPDATSATCSEFPDQKSKKKRILTWQLPMT